MEWLENIIPGHIFPSTNINQETTKVKKKKKKMEQSDNLKNQLFFMNYRVFVLLRAKGLPLHCFLV